MDAKICASSSLSYSFDPLSYDTISQVWFIFCADTLNTGFDAAFMYDRLVHNFGA